MECSYCKKAINGKNRTREHIIPKSLIEMFPDCNYSITKYGNFKTEAIIRDVCAKCNNGELSHLDAYGKEIVEQNFLKAFSMNDFHEFYYDFEKLSRWLLKLTYNSFRSNKSDISWFEENIDFINGRSSRGEENFSLFSGLFIYVAPITESWGGKNPVNISTPLIVDGEYTEVQNLSELRSPYIQNQSLIRVGAGMFLAIFWRRETTKDIKREFEEIILTQYPYSILSTNNNQPVLLERVSDSVNSIQMNIVHCYRQMFRLDMTFRR